MDTMQIGGFVIMARLTATGALDLIVSHPDTTPNPTPCRTSGDDEFGVTLHCDNVDHEADDDALVGAL